MASKALLAARRVSALAAQVIVVADDLECGLEGNGRTMTVGLNPSRMVIRLKSTAEKLQESVDRLGAALAAENAKNAKRKEK